MADIAALGLSVRSDGVVVATKRLRELDGQARRTEGAADRLGKSAIRAAAGFAAMAAATMGFRAVVSTLSNFETSMAAVAAITRATDEELRQLRDTAKELGATTEFSASQAADALKFLGMAGFQTRDAIAAIPAVLDLATASQMGLADAADISSNIMSAFGIAATDAARVADVLAAASSRANTDVKQLGDGMKFVGPVASALGISMNDTAAAIGVLSDSGIQGGMAGTGLRRVLSSLANATPQATAAIESLGLKVEDLNPATVSLTEIVDKLAATGMDAATALTIFGDRGGPAILALVENNEKLGRLTEGLKGVDGEAKRMADTMRDQLGGDLKGLFSAIEGIIIQLGESGLTSVLRAVIQSTTSLVRAITGAVGGFTAFVSSAADATGVSQLLGTAFGILAENIDVLGAAAVATAAFFAGRYAVALGTTAVQATAAAVTASIQLQMALGATSVSAALASIAAKGFALSLGVVRAAVAALLGPIGIAIAIVGALTAAVVLHGRETQRLEEIQREYNDRLIAANDASKAARERLEDFRKKTGEVSNKVDEASGKIRGFTHAVTELARTGIFKWLEDVNDQYGILAQQLKLVQQEQSASGIEGAALFEAQANKARELADAATKRAQAEMDLNAQLDEQARLNKLMETGSAISLVSQNIPAKLEAQNVIVEKARLALAAYGIQLQAIQDTNVDAFAGGLLDEERAAAEAAAEKVQETITGLRERILVEGQANDLQKEIVSNLLKAGLAIDDNSAGAAEIRRLTAEQYELEKLRTQEAKNLDRAKKAAETIADLEREVENLGRLKDALRTGEEAYLAVAEAIAVEDFVRRNGLEGMDDEIARIRELIHQRNALNSAIDTIRSGDPGGPERMSDTDRTRSRERFEDLNKDLRGGMNDPMQALRDEYAERLAIVDEFEKAYTDKTEEAARAREEITRQFAMAQTQLMVTSLGSAFGQVAEVMRNGLGEQSAAYKAALVAQKAAAGISAALAMYESIAKASAMGWPQNIPLIAQAITQGTQIISAIQGISTGFAQGGFTGHGGVNEVAGLVHRGEVVFSQADVARFGGPQNVDAMRRGVPMASNDNGGGRIDLNVTVSVDDDGRIQAYVNKGMSEAVNASVTISDEKTKARMNAAQTDARRPVISARGAA